MVPSFGTCIWALHPGHSIVVVSFSALNLGAAGLLANIGFEEGMDEEVELCPSLDDDDE